MTKKSLTKLGKPTNNVYKITPKHSLYRKFKLFKENRILREHNLNQLRKSIEEKNLLEMCPILICKKNGEFYIVDGAHRYREAVELNLDFYVYVYEGEVTPEVLARLNTNQKNWTISDFARSYAMTNGTKQVYSRYCEYYEDNNITHQILISLYNGKNHKGYGIKEFKNGELRCDPMTKDHIEDRLYKLKQLEFAAFNPSLSKVTRRKQSFHTAILNALSTPKFNYNKFINNLYSTKHSFNKYHNIVDMENEIFRIESVK